MSPDARSGQSGSDGLFASCRRLVASLLDILHTRVELFSREFERERIHLTHLVLLGVGAVFFFALGALTLTIFIIVLFWDSQRLLVIGFLTVLYLGIAAGLATYARREAARSSKPFAASMAELRKDRERFASHR